jgi:hypothetical protein
MKTSGFKDEAGLRQRCVTFLTVLIREMLKHNKPDLIELLQFLNKTSDEIEIIQNQWNKLHLIHWTCTDDTNSFWQEVLSYKDSQGINIFVELTYIAISMFTLPHSNAETERLFSQMNVVKNKLRNRLKLPMLNAVLTIRSGLKRFNKCCHNYPLSNDLIKKN